MTLEFLKVKYDNDEVEAKALLKAAIKGDAGFDLCNATGENIIVAPYKSAQVSAGLSIKLPLKHAALVYPRSSTFRRRGLFVVPGLIDCGYTGPIYTLVWHPNLDEVNRPIIIKPWERISQLIIIPIPQIMVRTVDKLPETERGEKGFGSTGL